MGDDFPLRLKEDFSPLNFFGLTVKISQFIRLAANFVAVLQLTVKPLWDPLNILLFCNLCETKIFYFQEYNSV